MKNKRFVYAPLTLLYDCVFLQPVGPGVQQSWTQQSQFVYLHVWPVGGIGRVWSHGRQVGFAAASLSLQPCSLRLCTDKTQPDPQHQSMAYVTPYVS